MLPSEFLEEIDSHGIYDAEALAQDFLLQTASSLARKDRPAVASWPTHSVPATAAAIAARGCGGEVTGDGACCWGYEVAEGLANHYAPDIPRKSFYGRGSRFREAVRALQEAGF